MSETGIVSFNLKCRNSGKVRAGRAAKNSWDDEGCLVAGRQLWVEDGADSNCFPVGGGLPGLASHS